MKDQEMGQMCLYFCFCGEKENWVMPCLFVILVIQKAQPSDPSEPCDLDVLYGNYKKLLVFVLAITSFLGCTEIKITLIGNMQQNFENLF